MILVFRNLRCIRRIHTKKDYIIVKATKKDINDMAKFLEDHFFKNDPSVIMSMVSEKPRPSALLIDDAVKPVSEGFSFLAKYNERDPRILGLCINGARPTFLPPNYMDELIEQVVCNKEKKLLELWSYLGLMPKNLPKTYYGEVKKVFDMKYLVVHPANQRKGIARALAERSRVEAMNNDFKFIRIECTSAYSARLANDLGMKLVYQLRYDDYKDEKGNPVFVNPAVAPHTSVWIYMQKLD